VTGRAGKVYASKNAAGGRAEVHRRARSGDRGILAKHGVADLAGSVSQRVSAGLTQLARQVCIGMSQMGNCAPKKRDAKMSPLETGRRNPASVASFPTPRPALYVRNAATWWHFEGGHFNTR
jgi:hypothetical protein